MILQDWWYTTLLAQQYPFAPPLRADVKADVLIVGAGMAGMSAAASFIDSGLKVVLLERNIVGGSSTGRSAGFLTPDSELELSQLIRRFGADGAKEVWEVPCRGIDLILKRAKDFDIDCDIIRQDSMFLGLGASGREDVLAEDETRRSLGFGSAVYEPAQLQGVFGGEGYTAGIRYGDTYGINALQFVQGLKRALMKLPNFEVHESTEVQRIEGHVAYTHAGSVTADQIIIASDKPTRALCPIAEEVFHAQTFLSISEPLSDAEVLRLFPSGDHLQCWDSTLVYTYFRLTGDQRLLLGGGSPLTTFLPNYDDHKTVISRVIRNFRKHFPFLADLQFIQFWPGLIDSSRDLLPVLRRDADAPYRHYVHGCVGLPWAAFCGDFAGRAVQGKDDVDEANYYEYFTDRRKFFLPSWAGKFISKPIEFGINHAWAKYRQIDTGRIVPRVPKEF